MAIIQRDGFPGGGMSFDAVGGFTDPSGDLCRRCGGSGDIWVVGDYAHERGVQALVVCTWCGGTGVWGRDPSEGGVEGSL